MIQVRKSIWPLREVIDGLIKEEYSQIQEHTTVFLRDVYDHIMRLIDTIEISRELIASLHELYLSGISNRMNEVMKVLTIIATIFIPLTFIVGIYGMNFEYMPELHWRIGYYIVWFLMVTIVIGMIFYFRKKKWI